MGKIIFVVDDSVTNLTLAEEALADSFNVLTFSSAEKMLPALQKITPDLILLDIEMPGMNGFEAMTHLKASDLYSKIPVIFLTAMNDEANETFGIELGAAGFIAKPFSAPELLSRIQTFI
ncbi:MAG: response regulator [Treponema sp.]|jgi:putative two-component system response regulator|nr:response regulator [Treponema sp.]